MAQSKASTVRYFVIDAFAERPFEGNPAAVCLLDAPLDVARMQLIAREMNLSETAFVSPRGTDFDLRWFTPSVEVELCGHATLASAHALWTSGIRGIGDSIAFHTMSGELRARADGEWIVLDFPAEPATQVSAPPEIAAGLGLIPRWVGRSRFDYCCELETEAQVRALAPDMHSLAALGTRGVIATARSSGRFDFVSRFFAPGAGVAEDPVTGSAHCTLGPHWAERLNKSELVAWQASARGGLVKVSVRGRRVHLTGRAFTVAEGRVCSA